jgi:hypothetical protein
VIVLDVERDMDEELLEDEDDWLDEDERRLCAAAPSVSAVAKASRETSSSFVIPCHVAAGCRRNLGLGP